MWPSAESQESSGSRLWTLDSRLHRYGRDWWRQRPRCAPGPGNVYHAPEGRPDGAKEAATPEAQADPLPQIARALEAAREVFQRFTPGAIRASDKGGGDPVTQADHDVDRVLRELLPSSGDGWLSEETADDRGRLASRRVWVVDPLDGTREFVSGIPEWCVSIGLVEDGRAVAGGMLNPATGETVLGSLAEGVTYNGAPVRLASGAELAGARVLASRTEVGRGEWARFANASYRVEPMGSVAYKLALVAAGRADATWTLVPKHEWDIAAGVALLRAAGGSAFTLEGEEPRFNQPHPLVSGLVAHRPGLGEAVRRELAFALRPRQPD
jgi:myo-inositol-1(or 4)-monophosphatase